MAKFIFGVIVGAVGAVGGAGVYMGHKPAVLVVGLAVGVVGLISIINWENE